MGCPDGPCGPKGSCGPPARKADRRSCGPACLAARRAGWQKKEKRKFDKEKRKKRILNLARRECRRLETYGFSPEIKLDHHHLLHDRSALRASLAKYPTKSPVLRTHPTHPPWLGVVLRSVRTPPERSEGVISICVADAFSTPKVE